VEEVAPGELAGERLTALLISGPVQRADGHLQRRDAAEAQVGGQPRGLVAGQVVVVLVAIGQQALPPGDEPLAAGFLAARGQARRGSGLGGKPADRCHGRQLEALRQRAVLAPGRRAPGPPVRGEDAVVAAAGRGEVAGRHHGQAGGEDQVDPAPDCRAAGGHG
jgi:hypothetical protein